MRFPHAPLSLLALAIVAPSLQAQDKPDPEAPKGHVNFGEQTGVRLDQSSKVRQFESIPTTPTIYDAFLQTTGGGGYWMNLFAFNVGAEDQRTALEGGKYGEFKWNLVWDQNPNFYSNTARTLYAETSPGVFSLPSKLRSDLQAVYWVPGGGTISVPASDPRSVALGAELGFYTLPAPNAGLNNNYPMHGVELKYLRRTGKAGFEYMGIEHWLFTLNYTQERRTGNQATSIFDGTSILEVAAPIQYKTQNLAFAAEYAKKAWFLKGTLNFSKFEDGVDRLYVDNPMRLTNDPAQLAGVYRQQQAAVFGMPTQPDNQAQSLNLVGGVTLPARHRLVLTFTQGTMSMDTALMPGSTIPYYPDQTGGRSAISAKLENSMWTARLTGDPLPMAGYSLDYRKWDLKDKTADYTFNPIGRGDSTAPSAGTTFEHEDQTRSKDTLKAEVHVSPFRFWRLGVGAGQATSTNEIRTVREVKDDTLTLKVDANYPWVAFHGSYTDLKRKPTFEAGLARFAWNAGTATNPYDPNVAGNETDTARRDSKLLNAVLACNPTETLSLDLSLSSIDNTFPDSPVHGLQSSKSGNYGIDVNWAPSEGISLLAAYVFEDFKYTLDSQYLGAAANTASNLDRWSNHVEDKVDTYKVGLLWRVTPKVDLQTDYDYSKGRSDSSYLTSGSYIAGLGGSYQGQGYLFDPKTLPGNLPYGYSLADAGPYLVQPEVVNKTTIWKTRLNYHLRKNVALSFMYWLQKYDRADWARDAMQPYMYSVDPGTNKSLFLGARIPSYDVSIYRASILYTF